MLRRTLLATTLLVAACGDDAGPGTTSTTTGSGGNGQGGAGSTGGAGGATTSTSTSSGMPLGIALDTTYGDTGVAFVDRGENEDVLVEVLRLPDDDRLLVGNTTDTDGVSVIFVARVNPNGTPDASYGTDGHALLPRYLANRAVGAALQPDGKIVIVGSSGTGGDLNEAIALRLTATGALDATFGTGGIATLTSSASQPVKASAVTVLSTGKLLVGYTPEDSKPRLVRLSDAGALDTTFGTAGVATFPVNHFGEVLSIRLLSDGSIVTACVVPFALDSFLGHFSASGVRDDGFGGQFGQGYVDSNWRWFHMDVDGSDRIVVSGEELARFGADGATDPSFPNGSVSDDILDLELFPDGSMIYTSDDLLPSDNVRRRTADGQFDATFGSAVVDLQLATHLSIDAIGTILVFGREYAPVGIPVAEVASDGTPSTTFGSMGIATVGSSAPDDFYQGAAFAPDGTVVLREANLMAKLTPAGALDGAFSSDGLASRPGGLGILPPDLAFDSMKRVLLPRGNFIERIDGAGAVDLGYGTNGLATISPPVEPNFIITSILVDSMDRAIVAGSDINGLNLVVARVTSGGALDPSFANGNGVKVAGPGFATSITIGLDDDIVVTSFWNNAGAVTRLNDDGTLDTVFDGDGALALDAIRVPARSIFTADGSLLVAGADDDCSAPDFCTLDTVVQRFDATGALDAAFGTAGELRYSTSGLGRPYDPVDGENRRLGLALDGTGAILLATGERVGTHEELAIVRAFADGTLDDAFGTNGVFLFGDTGNWHGRLATLLPDGKLLVAGNAFSPGGGNDLAVLRFTLTP